MSWPVREFVEWFEMTHPRIFNEVYVAFQRYVVHQNEDMTLNEDEKGDFFDDTTISELIQNLNDLGLPTTSKDSRRDLSIRLYNAVYQNFWSAE
tara:strand:+ start:199 stop:480 length:282 start_codon:yes stop_codon:yes gene_type:complete